jgi:sulfur carrier protein ThiS
LKRETEEVIILLNGKHVAQDDYLKEGDQLHIFSPIAGG